MKRTIFLIILFFILYQYIHAQHPDYGLHIQTYPLSKSAFTSMALNNGEPIEIKGKEITLNFSLQNRKDNVFGTVFRIITDNNQNIDLMYSVSQNDKRFPILVTKDVVHPIQKEIKCNQWISVNLTISPQDGHINLNYDSVQLNIIHKPLVKAQSIRIAFGQCPFNGYAVGDVASVNIKDIFYKQGIDTIYYWKMAKHNRDICYDEINHSPAVGKNPRWIIDKYITWKKIYSQEFSTSPSIAFNSDTETFYLANNSHKLYILHTHNQSLDTINIKGGEFVANYPNQMIYIPQRHELLSYNLDENLFSVFNPQAQTWEGTVAPTQEHDYWNNTLVYNPASSTLISFGGYGHYHYNNEMLISYPYDKKNQVRIYLNDIHPRYSSSSAIVDSTLYIFGGRGCPSGRQELSPRNYYDLYAVNLLTQQVNKLWDLPTSPTGADFHPSDNMIYDKSKKCFYLFSTLQGGILLKFSIDHPNFEPMSLPLEMNLESQYIYHNLYYSPIRQKLYTCILRAEVNGKSNVEIYELDFPPIAVSAFLQPDLSIPNKKSNNLRMWLSFVISLITIGALFLYRLKRKTKQLQSPIIAINETLKQELKPDLQSDIKIMEVTHTAPDQTFHNYECSQSCICFFGGFRVLDKEGNNVTNLFTPILKNLLILLILYTGKDEKGIVSHKMLQLLWSDKSEKSAQNNRNVYISKLRNILEQIGDIKIINKNSFWTIQFGEETFCDYLEALRLFNNVSNENNLERLLELLLHGAMLPNTEAEWIDVFKTDFSNMTIDLLSQLLKEDSLSDTLKLAIADTLFQHDYINEEALSAKCRILCQQGKKGLAKLVFDSFCKEYSNLLADEYPHSLKDIIGEEESSIS